MTDDLDDAHVEYRVTWFPPDREQRTMSTTDRAKALRWAPDDNPIVEAREVGPYRIIQNLAQGVHADD